MPWFIPQHGDTLEGMMLAITHVIVSLLLIQLLVLDRNEAFVAMMFGVFIDVDHLIGLGHYARPRGIASIFDLDTMMHAGGQWKSAMHSPIAVMVVGPLSIASRLAIPLLFWSVHIAMDYVEESVLGNFSTAEATLCVLAGLSLIGLRYAKFLESSVGGIWQYFESEINGLQRTFSRRHGTT